MLYVKKIFLDLKSTAALEYRFVTFSFIFITGMGLLFSATTNAQHVKIYGVRDTVALWDKKYSSEIYWSFYKVDFAKKTIKNKNFAFREGDKAPDLTNLNNLFEAERKDDFEVISATKFKVKRIKGTRVKRAWKDFATAGRTSGFPSYLFFIVDDTLRIGNSEMKYVTEKSLTEKYKYECYD